jgi:phosphatidylglycerophosphatase A
LRINIGKKGITGEGGFKQNGSPMSYSPLTAVIAKTIGSGFYCGYAPVAQGTAGSLLVLLPLMFIPDYWTSGYFIQSSVVIFVLSLLLFFVGVWASGVCEYFWGKDAGRIVIDEIVGMLVSLVFLPLTPIVIWSGFFLFRFFDIIKPPPVRFLERLPGGWGVVTDDVIAGVYTNLLLRIIIFLFPVMAGN